MQKDLFKIGEVAKLFNISVSTLRYYEKLGLVLPETVDSDTGYRYYSTDQFEALNTLRYLRLLDTPLPSIAEFFESRDIDKMTTMLEKQRTELEGRIRYMERLEKKVERRLEGIRRACEKTIGLIEDTVCPKQRIVWLKYGLNPVSNDDIERSIKILEGEQNEPMIFLGKVGIGLGPEKLIIREYDKYDVVFMILDDEDDYAGDFEYINEERCLSLCFRGTHKDAGKYYDMLMERMDQLELEPAGPSREIALIDWGLSQDPEEFVTKIDIPVKQTRFDI